MTQFELIVVGGGNMGAALLGGLLAANTVDASQVAIVELSPERRTRLELDFPQVAVVADFPPARSALIAVKPQHVADAVAAAAAQGVARVLSIAAGITTAAIAEAAGRPIAIIRAMPNTPALVGEGVTAIAAGPGADDADLEWAESMLAAVGLVVRVPESQIDAVTGLTGSGPAYVFLLAESLIDAGVAVGLDRATVEPMVTQLLVGSAVLLAERGDPGALRTAVTSPGGTTQAGLAMLFDRGVPGAVVAAVEAATARSRELSAE